MIAARQVTKSNVPSGKGNNSPSATPNMMFVGPFATAALDASRTISGTKSMATT